MQDDPDKDLFDNAHLLPPGFRQPPRVQGPGRFYVHLPNLSLEDGVGIPFRGGELRSVPFDEWRALDREVAEKRSGIYGETRPAFFVVDDIAVTGRMHAKVSRDARVLFSILTLNGMRMDPPRTSTAYVWRQGQVARFVGVHDRRTILNGPVRVRLRKTDEGLLQGLLDAVSRLEPKGAVFDLPELSSIVQACGRGGGEEAPIDDIMRLTVALEALLVKDVTAGITAAFVDRVGQFVREPGEDASELARDLRTLYALRSDALHGRDWADSLAGTGRDEPAWSAWAHQILLRAAHRVVAQVGGAADPRLALDTLQTSLMP
ncbi:hypothetical protein ACQ859_30065 [Roseateles chitinivorans]|uniref:hypothetical protein n=1 Tax=Roseateles chitinivorans TaxID=2917965 RepID=UPI003D674591